MLEFWDLGAGNNDTFITNGPIAKAIKYLKLKSFVKYQAMRDILIPAGENYSLTCSFLKKGPKVSKNLSFERVSFDLSHKFENSKLLDNLRPFFINKHTKA